jgi:hypothetical protein
MVTDYDLKEKIPTLKSYSVLNVKYFSAINLCKPHS